MILSQRCDSLITFSGDICRLARRALAFAAAFKLRLTAARFSGMLAGTGSVLSGAARTEEMGAGSALREPLPGDLPAEVRRMFDRRTTSPPPPFAFESLLSVF